MTVTALEKVKDKFQGLIDGGIIQLLQDTFIEAAPQIEDKVTEQLSRGERGDGSKLPDYSPVSVAYYGKPAGPIKLFDKGDYYAGVTVRVDREGYQIDDTDWKRDKLAFEYGDDILDLQKQSFRELKKDAIIPILQSNVRKFLAR